MHRRWLVRMGLWCGIALATAGVRGAGAAGDAATKAADPDQRAAVVEAQMSDAERLQLLHGIMALPFPGMAALPAGVPATAGYVHGIAHLGVPDLLESDASLGVVNPQQLRSGDGATAMPSGLAQAASFDPELTYRGGATIGADAAAHGFNVLLGGGTNLARDPRNGRNFEYFGEDPLLAGTLVGAAVAGTQSAGVVSTVKHFALNDQETLRRTLNAEIDEAALRESDLLAFELAIERGQPGAVMCAYNHVNGPEACGSDFLLNQVLKRDWGYRGWVMSDWGAVDDVSDFNHGLDQESGSQLDKQVWFDQPLQQALTEGRVTHAQLSAAVRRILRSLYAVGADTPHARAVDYAASAQVAREAASEGIVLLKNDAMLPLATGLKHVVVIGARADSSVLSGGGSSDVTPHGVPYSLVPIGGCGPMSFMAQQLWVGSSPLKALQARLHGVQIDFEPGYDLGQAAAVAARADAAIVFATRWQMEGCDAGDLHLPQGQDDLISAVARSNAHTVVVLETANPVAMPWLPAVKAVVEAWYPGQEGGAAIADVLTGAVNPSGHLPITFPASLEQNPRPMLPGLGLPTGSSISVQYPEGAQVGYRGMAVRGVQPLFPFGFGLSYTRFEMNDLQLSTGKQLVAHFSVRNSGERSGATVAQLYLVSEAGQPLQRLVGFQRVSLQPGETRQVELRVDPRLLAHWDAAHHGWRVDAGRFEFALGDSATQFAAHASTTLAARKLAP